MNIQDMRIDTHPLTPDRWADFEALATAQMEL